MKFLSAEIAGLYNSFQIIAELANNTIAGQASSPGSWELKFLTGSQRFDANNLGMGWHSAGFLMAGGLDYGSTSARLKGAYHWGL